MFILPIIIAASAAAANSFPSHSPEQLPVPYILKGVPVQTKHFPNQALILFSYGSSCGGIIFDSTTIITAAHCIKSKEVFEIPNEGITVYVGANERGLGYPHKVLFTVVHENYNEISLSHDIAILKLSQPLKYTENVQPKEFVPGNFVLPVGTECIASGYGRINSTHLSDDLRATPVILWDERDCSSYFRFYNPHTMVRGKGYPGSSACGGDSGGPLMCMHEGRWFLYGIISFTSEFYCGAFDGINGFTRLSPLYNWIRYASVAPQLT